MWPLCRLVVGRTKLKATTMVLGVGDVDNVDVDVDDIDDQVKNK